ncbi:peptidase [Streptomyces cinnamoneus]|uniref:Peptidase n=1 Tax=Streptomyces cinnamoneus TaxID=53446 RepID=A0A2G1XLU5_STRCJ|nr:alpha/beta hydrolase [Streptomyces cinnamoneus]PHQ52109.1 peptidase [Streptomyces cinnamoneus]PPT16189.1 alpha/beta hydrolase [Streptomyces cinnamoneus]
MFTSAAARRTASALSTVVATAIAAAVLPASAALAARQSVPARYAQQRLDWQPCQDSPLECATMTVPRDWHHPGAGADLTIAVSRHRASDSAKRRGVLMMAAGGPGGSGLKRPQYLAGGSPTIDSSYDVVSFDQRGVGRSTRAVCESDAEFADFFAGDFRDRSPAALERVVNRSRTFVENCRKRSGDLLPHLTTEQTVRDMDLFRSLLGERKISYYGASYATMVGAYYASLFPQRVERAVLDSNVGFDGTWEDFSKGQPMSFQRRFDEDFLPWLATYDHVYHYGATAAEAKATWERRRAALREHPLRAGQAVIGPNQLDNGAIQAIYNAGQGFEALATALAALEHWDTAEPREQAVAAKVFGSYSGPDFFAEYFSVTCNDTPWTRDMASWVERSGEDTANLPLVGARELGIAAVCAAWPKSPAPKVKVTGAGLPATLMLNSVHDPATYHEAAVRAHRALRGSQLVTVTGDGDHGQFENGNACVDGVVDTYLTTGAVPARDTTCPGKPLPVPAGAAAGKQGK